MSWHPIAKEVIIVLVIKVCVIAAIGYFFFGAETKTHVDSTKLQEKFGVIWQQNRISGV